MPSFTTHVLAILALLSSAASQSFVIGGKQPFFGTGLTFGDVDGDTVPELIVSIPVSKGFSGQVQFFRTRDRKRVGGLGGASVGFGLSCAALGDNARTGGTDLLIGAIDRAYLLSTKGAGFLKTFVGKSGSAFGATVAAAGDVDRDGFVDMLIGAYADSTVAFEAGYAELRSGKDYRLLRSFRGKTRNERLGRALAAAGDVNGDGFADFLIGSPGERTVRCFSGKDGSTLRSWKVTTSGRFGFAVFGGRDLNGDKTPDIIVGAPDMFTPNATPAVFVYSGKDGSTLRVITGAKGSWLGYSVAATTEMNGDGVLDILCGAPATANFSGEARLVSGKDGSTLNTYKGQPASALGAAVSGNLDWIVMGAPSRGNGAVVGAPGYAWRYEPFGSACTGASKPQIVSAAPQTGREFRVEVRGLARTTTFGFLVFGSSDRLWKGVNLPLDMSRFGMTGCSVYTGWDIEVPFYAFNGTPFRFKAAIPWSFRNLTFYNQVWVLDQKANPAGVATSRGFKARIGR